MPSRSTRFTPTGARTGASTTSSTLYDLATLLVTQKPNLRLPGDRLIGSLLAVIHEHELFHFRVELAAIHHRAASTFDHYGLYSGLHSWSSPGSDGLEEAVANAHKFDVCRSLYPELAQALDALDAADAAWLSRSPKVRSRDQAERGPRDDCRPPAQRPTAAIARRFARTRVRAPVRRVGAGVRRRRGERTFLGSVISSTHSASDR